MTDLGTPRTDRKGSVLPSRLLPAGKTITALMLREMATTFGRSPGGYVWALVEPLAAIALLSLAFSLAFHSPPLGNSFALFYAAGYLPYMLFHDVTQKVASATRFSRPLLSFGPVGWLETILARGALNGLIHLIVFFVVVTILLRLESTIPVIDWAVAILAFFLAFGLGVGVGCLNCFLFLAFPAWERLWAIALRPMFLISGVIFLMEDVPEDYQGWLWFNPLFHVTGLMRQAVFSGYRPNYVTVSFVAGVAAVCLLLGLVLLRRHHDDLVFK